jgi:lipopolysaccharide transport system ATP-binding protein
MTTVIQAERLGKRYHRGAVQERGMLRDSLMQFARAPLAAFRRPKQETFWALEDVSLQVKEGEVLGLIGRNGAGKTTLLKILSRITKPTAGYAEIRGRVRSLLEVGTGFHGELTGRENTYLGGSILGMKKEEIERKMDEIVAFAEIEKFIDTPVKHYSSGMYVRLAFAVAAHLEPEILLVDEVLAVGDINFQKKCLGKMGDVAKQGRTIVLVSHQMNQMRRLCHRVAWVDGGHVRMAGATHEVVSAYETAMIRGDRLSPTNGGATTRGPGTKARFLQWEIVQPDGRDRRILNHFGPVTVKFTIEIYEAVQTGHHGIALQTHDGQLVWGWATDNVALIPGEHEFCYTFPMLPVRPGAYEWLVSLWEGGRQLDVCYCVPEMIVATEVHQHRYDVYNGLLNIPSKFSIVAKTDCA